MLITKFDISNYRSLQNLQIDKFDSTTIFYGDNNAGKSNILSALYTIFKRKKKIKTETAPISLTDPKNFYEGIVENFSNNFFNNDYKDITFKVVFSVKPNEIEIPSDILHKLIGRKRISDYQIMFRGNISPAEATKNSTKDWGEITAFEVTFYDTLIYSHKISPNKTEYFPTFKKENQGTLEEVFTKLIEPFNNCVLLIESSRDMLPTSFTTENEIKENINSQNFKKFLHSLYLSEEKHYIFENINEVFNKEPFSFGQISFADSNKQLELMIKENNVRLPIKHLGSGVLQTLYIISRIIYSKSKIVCIEELEQNLSPKRQNLTLRKLQSMIGDNSTTFFQQLIISSHSSVFKNQKLGTIHFIEKKGFVTTINNTKDALKQHLIDAAPEPKTYTEQEWNANWAEQKKFGEEGFRR